MIWRLPHPLPPLERVSLLSLPVCRFLSFLRGEGGRGAESYDREKAWSYKSLNTLCPLDNSGQKEWTLSQLLY
jgi:hypothetical protein